MGPKIIPSRNMSVSGSKYKLGSLCLSSKAWENDSGGRLARESKPRVASAVGTGLGCLWYGKSSVSIGNASLDSDALDTALTVGYD